MLNLFILFWSLCCNLFMILIAVHKKKQGCSPITFCYRHCHVTCFDGDCQWRYITMTPLSNNIDWKTKSQVFKCHAYLFILDIFLFLFFFPFEGYLFIHEKNKIKKIKKYILI